MKMLCIGGPIAGDEIEVSEPLPLRVFIPVRPYYSRPTVSYKVERLLDVRPGLPPLEHKVLFCPDTNELLIEHLLQTYKKLIRG